MANDEQDDNAPDFDAFHEVGYGKPPKKNRFKKGASGNPAGRPKGPKSNPNSMIALLDSPMVVVEGGKRKILTKEQALERTLFNRALTGKASDMKCLLDYMKMRNVPEARAKENALKEVPSKLVIEYIQGPSPPKPIVRT